MNLLSFTVLFASTLTIVDERQGKDRPWKLCILYVTILVTITNILFDLIHFFFISRKNRWKRLKRSIGLLLFGSYFEDFQDRRKISSESIYCNPFLNEPTLCSHSDILVLGEMDPHDYRNRVSYSLWENLKNIEYKGPAMDKDLTMLSIINFLNGKSRSQKKKILIKLNDLILIKMGEKRGKGEEMDPHVKISGLGKKFKIIGPMKSSVGSLSSSASNPGWMRFTNKEGLSEWVIENLPQQFQQESAEIVTGSDGEGDGLKRLDEKLGRWGRAINTVNGSCSDSSGEGREIYSDSFGLEEEDKCSQSKGQKKSDKLKEETSIVETEMDTMILGFLEISPVLELPPERIEEMEDPDMNYLTKMMVLINILKNRNMSMSWNWNFKNVNMNMNYSSDVSTEVLFLYKKKYFKVKSFDLNKSSLVNFMDAMDEVSLSNRECCFVSKSDPLFKKNVPFFGKGYALGHCLGVLECISEICSGKSVSLVENNFGDILFEGREIEKLEKRHIGDPCIEGAINKILRCKFGLKFPDFIDKYLDLVFFSPKLFLVDLDPTKNDLSIMQVILKKFIATEEIPMRQNLVKNWQWKRFRSDMSYVFKKLGAPGLKHLDLNVPPRKICVRMTNELDSDGCLSHYQYNLQNLYAKEIFSSSKEYLFKINEFMDKFCNDIDEKQKKVLSSHLMIKSSQNKNKSSNLKRYIKSKKTLGIGNLICSKEGPMIPEETGVKEKEKIIKEGVKTLCSALSKGIEKEKILDIMKVSETYKEVLMKRIYSEYGSGSSRHDERKALDKTRNKGDPERDREEAKKKAEEEFERRKALEENRRKERESSAKSKERKSRSIIISDPESDKKYSNPFSKYEKPKKFFKQKPQVNKVEKNNEPKPEVPIHNRFKPLGSIPINIDPTICVCLRNGFREKLINPVDWKGENEIILYNGATIKESKKFKERDPSTFLERAGNTAPNTKKFFSRTWGSDKGGFPLRSSMKLKLNVYDEVINKAKLNIKDIINKEDSKFLDAKTFSKISPVLMEGKKFCDIVIREILSNLKRYYLNNKITSRSKEMRELRDKKMRQDLAMEERMRDRKIKPEIKRKRGVKYNVSPCCKKDKKDNIEDNRVTKKQRVKGDWTGKGVEGMLDIIEKTRRRKAREERERDKMKLGKGSIQEELRLNRGRGNKDREEGASIKEGNGEGKEKGKGKEKRRYKESGERKREGEIEETKKREERPQASAQEIKERYERRQLARQKDKEEEIERMRRRKEAGFQII